MSGISSGGVTELRNIDDNTDEIEGKLDTIASKLVLIDAGVASGNETLVEIKDRQTPDAATEAKQISPVGEGATVDSDEATFTVDSSHIWNADDFVSFTGKIDLDIYNSVNNTILLEFGLDGVLVGNSVNLNNFIDTGDFAEQSFVIPKAEFGLATQNFNSMRLTITRSGGTKPTIKFDDFQWENTGTPIIFSSTTPAGTRFHITEIRIRIEDAISTVLTDASMPNLLVDQLLGVGTLANGIIFSRTEDSKILFSVTLKNLGDFLATGSDLINATGNATNTGFTLVVTFPEPIVLKGGLGNSLSFTINDNLSGLSRFTAAARGAIEI